MLRSQSEAEDASQEVFLRIHKAFETYDPTRPLTPWVSRITYNVCLQRLRKVKREGPRANPETLDRMENGRALPEDEAAGREATGLLLDALDQLSAQDQALLTLRYREGLSDSEVAEAVGMPVNTVKTRIFRARSTLKKRLAPMLRDR
jgi:RNA polymerase sigma-70 factor (ECF subfamily)